MIPASNQPSFTAFQSSGASKTTSGSTPQSSRLRRAAHFGHREVVGGGRVFQSSTLTEVSDFLHRTLP